MSRNVEYEKAYNLARDYIKEHGILMWFWNYGDGWSRGVFKAINDFGVLSDDEEIVYNRIWLTEENRIYYQGGSVAVENYTEEEISGAKKWMAHTYTVRMKDRGLTINGTEIQRGAMGNN